MSYGCSHYLTPAYERTTRAAPFLCGAGIFIASVTCGGNSMHTWDFDANAPRLCVKKFWAVKNHERRKTADDEKTC